VRAVVGLVLTLSACTNPSDFGLVCQPGQCPNQRIDGTAHGGAFQSKFGRSALRAHLGRSCIRPASIPLFVTPAKRGSKACPRLEQGQLLRPRRAWIPAFAQGGPGKNRGSTFAAKFAQITPLFYPLPPPAGGEGRRGGPPSRFAALPTSPSPALSRRGPSLSP
jgi:hypothetical protein